MYGNNAVFKLYTTDGIIYALNPFRIPLHISKIFMFTTLADDALSLAHIVEKVFHSTEFVSLLPLNGPFALMQQETTGRTYAVMNMR